MAEPLFAQPWRSYRWLMLAVGLACSFAGGLHLLWMPHVSYDPFAPFRVFWITLEGSYFPLAALLTWLAARAPGWRAMSLATLSVRSVLHNLVLALLSALVLAKLLRWQGSVNLVALVAWLFLSLQASQMTRHERQAALIEWLIVAVLFAAASYAFTVIKAGLFHLGVAQDAAIIEAESMLFGQPPLYQRMADLGAGLSDVALRLAETVYFQFFAHMLLVSIFLGARRDGLERRRYVTALIVCYIAGAVAYYVLPGLGPVFHDSARFGYLEPALQTTRTIQEKLAYNTGAAQKGFVGLEQLDVYAFIACMPSLHLAHEAVMLYFSRHSPIAFAMSALFFAASCVAVIVLGWHYVLDIPFGILLGIAALLLAVRLVRATAQPRR